MGHGNVTITTVEWSPPQIGRGGKGVGSDSGEEKGVRVTDSLVAAAGSNGVIAVWNAKQAFFSEGSGESSTLANQRPEAILSQEHTRAVNSLAWHPKRPGILLSASQDSTVKLWERREVSSTKGKDNDAKKRFGFFNVTQNQSHREFNWYCKSTFEPKSEAVREVQWSKFQDDVFAFVTMSGSLVVYSMHVTWKAIVKIAAHAGDASSLDWHPTRPYVIATGGSGDRCVKVWDVESSVNMKPDDSNMGSTNSNTWNTARSEMSTNSTSSNETERSTGFGSMHSGVNINTINSRSIIGVQASGRYKSSSNMTQHVITIASSVTKIRWRPPAFDYVFDGADEVDRHDSMFAVATARLTSAGGSGVISLWSTHRPFMPLSVVEGHEDGAVADFVWMQTPPPSKDGMSDRSKGDLQQQTHKVDQRSPRMPGGTQKSDDTVFIRSGGRGDVESILFDNNTKENEGMDINGAIWQHVLSVGRDGKCNLQSFVRGDRPISRVPSACFAMANLSPFQRGYGSLQLFSVHQNVPNGPGSDFELTALRQDSLTSRAPGVFKEAPLEVSVHTPVTGSIPSSVRRLPERTPELIFNVVDQGPLDENGLPSPNQEEDVICVAPEVVHLSRFASSYKLYPDDDCLTRVELCLHNADVAEDLRCGSLARMWRTVASMLSGSGLDELPSQGLSSQPSNAMHFVILPTVKALLLERAEAGDVQTCVALCEVLQVVEPDNNTRLPGLELNLVREWYLAYIDLLQQMCLFTSATYLIKKSLDPFIGALNQQSTTIHESCPRCGKVLQPSPSSPTHTSSIKACQNCRRRVGLCFLCHEPVKGVFVWCPGCGHGGHLDHALLWFGGPSGKTVREVCPTGCGHRCNLVQSVSAFPRTESLRCLPVTLDGSETIEM